MYEKEYFFIPFFITYYLFFSTKKFLSYLLAYIYTILTRNWHMDCIYIAEAKKVKKHLTFFEGGNI